MPLRRRWLIVVALLSFGLLPGCGGAKHDVLNCWYGSPLQPRPGSQVSTMRAFGLLVPVRLAEPMPGMLKPTPYGRPLVQR